MFPPIEYLYSILYRTCTKKSARFTGFTFEEHLSCRRALDLVYALVNENNIKALTKELLEYLKVSDTEFKPDLTAKICQLVLRFAPDKQWHFDSILQVWPHKS